MRNQERQDFGEGHYGLHWLNTATNTKESGLLKVLNSGTERETMYSQKGEKMKRNWRYISQGEHKHTILAYLPSSSQHWIRPQGVKVFMKEIKITDKMSLR